MYIIPSLHLVSLQQPMNALFLVINSLVFFFFPVHCHSWCIAAHVMMMILMCIMKLLLLLLQCVFESAVLRCTVVVLTCATVVCLYLYI